jgi:hypothetical protein
MFAIGKFLFRLRHCLHGCVIGTGACKILFCFGHDLDMCKEIKYEKDTDKSFVDSVHVPNQA